MSKKFLKVAGITICSVIAALYIIFLVTPMFVNLYLKEHNAEIVKLLEDVSGYKFKLSNMKIMTTPKLTAGFNLGEAKISLQNEHEFLSADNLEIKMSLVPLLARRIELDKISVENAVLTLEVLKDGHFLIEKYPPKVETSQTNEAEVAPPMAGLPFGFKISNHLPNIYLTNYDINFVDVPTGKKYSLDGDKFNITDFIINKKVKINANGEIVFDGEKQFTYDVKVLNNVMPNIDLNDLLFPEEVNLESENIENLPTKAITQKTVVAAPVEMFNVIDLFKGIHQNQLQANLLADVKIDGTLENIDCNGNLKLDDLTVAVNGKKLEKSIVNMEMKGKTSKITSTFYTSYDKNEATTLIGDIKTGKNPEFNMHFLSNASLNNIIKLLNSVAKSFGINDLETLSATGNFDANCWIIGNTKKVKSSGYLKIPAASLKYGLYNVSVDKINADVNLDDNNVNIKNISFSILNQPLTINGTLSSDAVADIKLLADRLPIKGLIMAAGQVTLLKDNNFNSGSLSVIAGVKGKLTSPVPSLDVIVENVNVKNVPSNTTVKLLNTKVNLVPEGKSYKGIIKANSIDIINPMLSIRVPEASVSANEKDILIDNAYLMINNSRINLSGSVEDYMNKNLAIKILAKGNLVASDLKNMLPKEFRTFVGGTKGSLPLNVTITGNDKIQNIDANLTANPNNYFTIFDIDALKNKNTTIKSHIKVANDSLKFSNTGIYVAETPVATMSGGISNLSKNQKMAIDISVPALIGMPIPGFPNNTLVTMKGNLSVLGNPMNPSLKGNISIPSLKIPDMKVALEELNVNLNGLLANGNGTLKKVVSGGIVASDLTSDFSFNMKNNVLYLKNIKGNAFDGNVNGNVSYNIMNGLIGVDLKGANMKAITVIEGAAGIKNALSGTLGFDVKITTSGATDVDMIKNLKGKVSFDIKDGAFGSIGRIENLVKANNIMTNVIMKAAVATISTVPVVKNSANFEYINGELTFNDGWANLVSIKTSGPSMSYFIQGRYNILNASANMVILGRLGSDIVAVLGPIGDLSVSKLTSFIPKFGTATANIINAMTTNPNGEKISEIPALSGGNEVYKDFKVNFNGGIESSSSVKSFKWLSSPDMSAIETPTLKEQLNTSKEQIKTDFNSQIDAAKERNEQRKQDLKDSVQAAKDRHEQRKQEMKDSVQNVKDSVDEIKNLFKF